MSLRRLLLPAVLTAALLSACGGGDGAGSGAAPAESQQQGADAPAADKLATRVEPLEYNPAASAKAAAVLDRGQRPAAAVVHMGALNEKRAVVTGKNGLVQIGTGRAVLATADAAGTSRLLNWVQGANGHAAAVTFNVDGAEALRVGLLVRQLPGEAVVRGYVGQGETLFQATGFEILNQLRLNREAGDRSDAGATWWTPIVDHAQVTLEIQVPAGTAPDAVEVAFPGLSHLHVKSGDLNAKIGESDACEQDITCNSATDVQSVSKSVARMTFIDGFSSFVCTGTLLNNTSNDLTPYFLSAHHCISRQTVASTLQTFWFYKSPTCNVLALSSLNRTTTGLTGATLLHSSLDTDVSFMRLNGTLPAGVVFSGWSTDRPTGAVLGVHHPSGDLQKYSTGNITGFQTCSLPNSQGGFSCTTATAVNDPFTSNFVSVVWGTGTTEGGSSGSGIFSSIGGTRYLVGQLRGGGASCSTLTAPDTYGRFDRSYYAKLGQWLSPGNVTQSRAQLYRFLHKFNGTHFYTASQSERIHVQTNLAATYTFEGPVFFVYTSPVYGSRPVYRFYKPASGSHFYTMNESELASVVGTLPQYQFEGPAWYAQPDLGGTATPLYRFFNPNNGAHFYTNSETERTVIQSSNWGFIFEGPAYYSWQAE